MILKKEIINGREIYMAITFEEAKLIYKDSELSFTDEKEKEDFYRQVEAEEKEYDYEYDDYRYTNTSYKYEKVESDWEANFKRTMKDAFKKAGEVTRNLGTELDGLASRIARGINKSVNSYNTRHKNYSGKTDQLLEILPFMDKSDIHSTIRSLSDEDIESMELEAFLPFLDEEDCDYLFLKHMNKGIEINVINIAPYVSDRVLTTIVDKYLNGELNNFDINALYPYLSKKDVKRIFNHIMNK